MGVSHIQIQMVPHFLIGGKLNPNPQILLGERSRWSDALSAREQALVRLLQVAYREA